ncbi:hypothetical protein ACFL2U_01690 [Patescibacteria group bacterium]
MVEEKFVCPFCGFESNGAGLCPTCDQNLQKVCNCGSDKFSTDCCGETPAEPEDKTAEELIKAEVSGESLTELAKEDIKKQEEEEELKNVEEVKD